jgi:hypothetical protein
MDALAFMVFSFSIAIRKLERDEMRPSKQLAELLSGSLGSSSKKTLWNQAGDSVLVGSAVGTNVSVGNGAVAMGDGVATA